jgi:HlyD family secretion protein
MKYVIPFLVLLLGIFTSCSRSEVGIQPTMGTVTESVYTSGTVRAQDQYTVFSTVNGVLQAVKVSAGQTIESGQVLFALESDKAQLNTDTARLAYQLSQENSVYIKDKIAEMELRVQTVKNKLQLDESLFKRNKNAVAQGGISEIDFEAIQLAFKTSKLNYEAAGKQLTLLKLQLVNEQNRNKIALKYNQKSQSDFQIKSAFTGQLFDILVKEGMFITTQTPLAIIGKSKSFLLALDVDENDMVKVALGQKMVVTLDSYKGIIFDAVVNKIYPIMDERSRTFKIEAYFVAPPIKLYPNLTVEGNIIIQTKTNVITIPKKYLIDNEFVTIANEQKRKVKIGLSDYKNVEILSGLKQNETIYLPK